MHYIFFSKIAFSRRGYSPVICYPKTAYFEPCPIFHSIRQNHSYKKNANDCLKELKAVLDPNSHTGKIASTEGVPALLRYLNSSQTYEVRTTKADWGGILSPDSPLLGKLGHHVTIVLPEARKIEKGAETDLDTTEVLERESRVTTGRTIEKLWNTHLNLQRQSKQGLGLFDRESIGLFHYRPFERDCFTYVNRILDKNGEPTTNLRKAGENEAELRVLVDKVYSTAGTVLVHLFFTKKEQ